MAAPSTPRVVALSETVLRPDETQRVLARMGELSRDTYARTREYLTEAATPDRRAQVLQSIDREMTYLGQMRRRFSEPPPNQYSSHSV
jgi:hypothetical protein